MENKRQMNCKLMCQMFKHGQLQNKFWNYVSCNEVMCFEQNLKVLVIF